MAQAFNTQGKPAMDKNMIVKYGPAAGGGIAIFGLLLTGLGFLLPWLKTNVFGAGVTLNGLDFLTKTGDLFANSGDAGKNYLATVARGSSFNALMCNLPFFLCGALIIAILSIVAVFAKKFPSEIKLYSSMALGLLGLFSCCPSVLFFADMQKKMWNGVDLQFGFYLAVFGIGVILLGGIVGIVATLIGGGFPRRNRP
jgi:hypothetical protein